MRTFPVPVAIGLNPPASEDSRTQVECIGHVFTNRRRMPLNDLLWGVEFDVDPRVTVSFQGHHLGTSHVVIGELFAAGVNAICLVCQSLAAVHFVLELDVGQLVFQLNCV